MEPATRSSPIAYAALAIVALLAVVGWWRAIDQGGELEELRAASAVTAADLNGRIVELNAMKGAGDDEWVRVGRAKQALRQLVSQQ